MNQDLFGRFHACIRRRAIRLTPGISTNRRNECWNVCYLSVFVHYICPRRQSRGLAAFFAGPLKTHLTKPNPEARQKSLLSSGKIFFHTKFFFTPQAQKENRFGTNLFGQVFRRFLFSLTSFLTKRAPANQTAGYSFATYFIQTFSAKEAAFIWGNFHSKPCQIFLKYPEITAAMATGQQATNNSTICPPERHLPFVQPCTLPGLRKLPVPQSVPCRNQSWLAPLCVHHR